MSGVEMIAEERKRQIEKLGYSLEHDQQYSKNTLPLAAIAYLGKAAGEDIKWIRSFQSPPSGEITENKCDPFPFDPEFDKRNKHDPIRLLTIAGAWIAAEIDRRRECLNLPS